MQLEDSPYNFSHSSITEDASVDLYPKFSTQAEVTFCGQYDTETRSFPVAHTRRADLVDDGSGQLTATVKISDLSAAWFGDGSASMSFYAWSRTPVSTPGAGLDDNGAVVHPIVPDEQGCITVTGDTKLYPLFKNVHWLSFYAARSGMSAGYNGPRTVFEGEGIASPLPTTSRPGYEFQGWYIGGALTTTVVNGESVETVDFTSAAQVSNPDGSLRTDNPDFGGSAYVLNGRFYINTDVTLYARWKANYRVVLWKQNPNTGANEYAETKTYQADIGAQVSVPDELKAAGAEGYYHADGYQFDHCDDPAVIQDSKTATVLNVYYVPEPGYTPASGAHTLQFVDSTNPNRVFHSAQLNVGESVAEQVPADPASDKTSVNGRTVYQFGAWYLDRDCTLPANPKTLRMPGRDLTLYAGWTPIKFKVNIDTNYGALYHYDNEVLTGTGATWFSNTYEDEPISEYTHVKRDYVESSSGKYYFANRDRSYNDPANRQTFYTKAPGEATEDTTFEYAPGVYSYALWYEVGENGVESEEPYDFTQRTDHDTTLRLHWRKSGTYYLGYDAGAGSLVGEDDPTLILDDTFQDCADVTLNHTAAPPSGSRSSFVGWQVRGSSGSFLYAPGQTLPLHAQDAIRTSGKDVIWLDAVYSQVDTASIIYDANGGAIRNDGSAYFGTGRLSGTTADQTLTAVLGTNAEGGAQATVSNLENNSDVTLSDGTGFYRDNAVFLGWSTSDDPNDESAQTYLTGSMDTCAVDTSAPVRLYAIWGVKVTWHLNVGSDVLSDYLWSAEGNTWQSPYTRETTTAGETVYTRVVRLGAPAERPESLPQYIGAGSYRMFLYWSDHAEEQTENDSYSFDAPVNAPLDLYARWGGPRDVPVHAVDASAEALTQDPAGWTKEDIKARGSVTALSADSHVTAPAGYAFAFAAAARDLDSVSEKGAVDAVRYDSASRRTQVRRAGSSEFTSLENGYSIYFVYYQEKALSIGYKAMDSAGLLNAPTGLNGSAPAVTQSLGQCQLESVVSAPLSLVDSSYTHYAFAVGSANAASAANLDALTDAADSGSAASLSLRNTWRGFQYSTDGTNWVSCGYAPTLYVIYYTQHPTLINLSEVTVGTPDVLDVPFPYHLKVTQNGSEMPLFETDLNLKNGEVKPLILFFEHAATAQTVSVTQSALSAYTTTVDDSLSVHGAQTRQWSYTSDGTRNQINVAFTNTLSAHPVSVHVARVETSGTAQVVCRDDLRGTDPSTFSFDLPIGQTKALREILPPEQVYQDASGVYSYASALYAPVVASGESVYGESGAVSIAYRQTEDGTGYELALLDKNGGRLAALDELELYYLYSPMPKIQYVRAVHEGGQTRLERIRGSLDGTSVSDEITYDGATLTMNGQKVAWNQSLEVSLDDLVISQSGHSFRMPALLDQEIYPRYLRYSLLGIGRADLTDLSQLSGCSDSLTMRLRVKNNTLQYNDGTKWTNLAVSGTPTIYAVYEEKGYDLQITKTVDTSFSGANSIFTSKVFTVTIASESLRDGSYRAEGAESESVTASGGKITLPVRDGSKIKLRGLPRGSYTITESDNENYTLSRRVGPIVSPSSDDPVPMDSSSFVLNLDTERRVDLFNSPKPLCKLRVYAGEGDDTGSVVLDERNQERRFYTLNSALDYIEQNIPNKTATIEMLNDYLMPKQDKVSFGSGYNLTITTASAGVYTYPVSGGTATISRDSGLTDAPLFHSGSGLSFNHVTLDGNNVASGAALVESEGSLSIGTGAVLRRAVNSGNGGAVYAESGSVSVNGGTLSGNQAAKGGAIYYGGNGSVTIAGNSTRLTNNTATQDGGALYTVAGTLALNAGILSGNQAKNGGGLYAESTMVTAALGSVSGNQAENGGGFYVDTGTAELNGTGFSGNEASVNGGGVYNHNGTVSVSAGTLSGNKAENGCGGAIYDNIGSVTVNGGTFNGENTAQNGAAVFVEAGSATFSGGSITGNTATQGGAVGVGVDSDDASSAKLTFSGTPVIQDNLVGGQQRNVCLNADSDGVINMNDLANGAYVGIYVPDKQKGGKEYLFRNRGDVGARFGRCTGTNVLTAIHNDREPTLGVYQEATSMKLIWGNPIQVEVRYVDNYGAFDSGFPPKNTGVKKWGADSYYPSASTMAFSEVGEDLRDQKSIGLGTSVYGTAFVSGETNYANYVTRLLWEEETANSGNYVWKVEKRDGSRQKLTKTVVLYYSEPTYMSIENNTEHKLTVDPMTVLGQSVINNYGLVFARDGAIQSALLPVTEDDLTLEPTESINILIPGGSSQAYSLTSSFTKPDGTPLSGTEQVRIRRTNATEVTKPVSAINSTPITGSTLAAGNTYEIIFGDDKYICQIPEIPDAEGHPTKYTTMRDAAQAAEASAESQLDADPSAKPSFEIQMLVDYLMPANDVFSLPDTSKITGLKLTTATSYPGYATGSRVTISRHNNNTASPLFSLIGPKGEISRSLEVHDLYFDGKSLTGACDGGAFKTVNWTVNIHDSNFKGFEALNGGAIFVSFGEELKPIKNNYREYNFRAFPDGERFPAATSNAYASYDYEHKALLTVSDTDFTNCKSWATMQRSGGGAVWSNAMILTLERCDFDGCTAIYDSVLKKGNSENQGGGVFHRIDGPSQDNYSWQPYNAHSRSIVNDCTFKNCAAQAGGGIECDAQYIKLKGCTFTLCKTQAKDGGAVNAYYYEQSYTRNEYDSEFHVENCDFIACTANRYAGAIRSLMKDTEVKNCNFYDCSANFKNIKNPKQGGGTISVTNDRARSLTVSGCTISGSAANGGAGGAIYTESRQLTINQGTTISNCVATGNDSNGGGVYQKVEGGNATDSFAVIDHSTIEGCSADQNGGAYATTQNVKSLSVLNGSKISYNTAKGTGGGGGIYFSVSYPLTVKESTVKGNMVTNVEAKGGGIYTKKDLTLYNATIVENQLMVNNAVAENAAGVYLTNDATLYVGNQDNPNVRDRTIIADNVTLDRQPSNLRLPVKSNGENNNRVKVYSDMGPVDGVGGVIYVVNAWKAGTQFAASQSKANPDGFSDVDAVFQADYSTLHGIVSRQDNNQKKIIWAGPPICKLTTQEGRLLYFKKTSNTTAADPAIFDVLDDGLAADSTAKNNRTSAFRLLRNPPDLYYYDANGTVKTYKASQNLDYRVEMIVGEYELTNQITTNASRTGLITLTTASKEVPYQDDIYPLEAKASGNRCTIKRPASGLSGSMMDINSNMLIETIVLDGNGGTGGGTSVSATDGGILNVNGNGNTVTLGTDATFQNSTAPNGGAVQVTKGEFKLHGGVIRFCKATTKGGGVYMNDTNSTFTFDSGSIVQCNAAQGGGIAIQKGKVHMTGGGVIERNSAQKGGGVYVGGSGELEMSGTAKIMRNSATSAGGGVGVENENARIYFYQRPSVSGNTCTASEATGKVCNVEIDQPDGTDAPGTGDHFGHNANTYNHVINSKGLLNGANIGIYVPGGNLFNKHGSEGTPFGSYENNTSTATLYGFINDRTGYKGGLIENPSPNTIYWIKIFSLTVKKEVAYSQNVTDAKGNPIDEGVLNKDFRFHVNLSGVSSGAGTQYHAYELGGEYGGMTFYGNQTLSDGTTGAVSKYFTRKDGEQITAENLPIGIHYETVEDYTPGYATAPALNYKGIMGENSNASIPEAYWYESIVTYRNIYPVCKITDANGHLLYQDYTYERYPDDTTGGTYRIPAVYTELKDAVDALQHSLYPSKDALSGYNISNGVQIQMLAHYSAPEAITIPATVKKLTLTTATRDAADGFRFRGTGERATIFRGYNGASVFTVNGTLRLKNINLDGKKANRSCNSGNGGLAIVNANGILSMTDTVSLLNSHTSGDGGAVYVQNKGVFQMQGGGTINHNSCGGNGAGVYLAVGSRMEMSGAVNFGGTGTDGFGEIKTNQGNLCTQPLINATNGGKEYSYGRQDIYLVEGSDSLSEHAPTSIHLTGNLSGKDGSIWVWCVTKPHREMLKPFAVIDDPPGVIDAKSYTVFRNAQTDKLTYCGSDTYLTGVTGENPLWVYWTGGFDVEFVKIDGFGEKQKGATFTLYKDQACTEPYTMGDDPLTATSADGTASYQNADGETLALGTVLFSKVPAGVYYMKETTLPEGYENALWKKKSDGSYVPICDKEEGTAEPNVYLVLVGEGAKDKAPASLVSNLTDAVLTAQYGTGTDDERSSALFLIDRESGKAATVPDIRTYGVMNLDKIKERTILKKTEESFSPLKGAKFDVLRYDRTVVAADVTSAESGVIWTGTLHRGVYYLHEKVVPDGYQHLGTGTNQYNWYKLEIDEEGIHEPELLTADKLSNGAPKPPTFTGFTRP